VARPFESTAVWLKVCIVLLALAGAAWALTGSEIILGLAAGMAGVAVLALAAEVLDVLGVPWNRWRDR
jgi:cytochrome c oxidase assembly factor CtaG